MELSDIITGASALLDPDLTGAQTALLSQCCAAARARCLAQLGRDVTEELQPLVLQACILMGAGLYLDSAGIGEISAFTAGTLSVTTGSGRAQRLKAAALELLAPALPAGGAFLGVRG